jgi:nicotinate-nucleotide adenylyltransferase
VRVGLFGGSFDPIHRGHVEPVREARRTLALDRVVYLPTAQPPHKPKRQFAPALARFAMAELALLGEEGLYVSPHELTLGRPAFTVESVEHFRRELPAAEIFLFLGADSFLDLPSWRRWRELPELAHLVVLARPGWQVEGGGGEAGHGEELRGLLAGGRVIVLEQRPVDLSSSRIRELLAAGEEPPPGALAPLVLEYVRKYQLYR